MKSAIAHLGTQNFPRLRLGIGKPQKDDSGTVSHVLGRFSTDETQIVAQMLQLVLEAVELSFKQGVEQAMNRFNNRTISLSKDNKLEGVKP